MSIHDKGNVAPKIESNVQELIPVDLLGDGVLWMINKTIFHPRGYAIAVDDKQQGKITLMGDGSEPWTFDHSLEPEKFAAFSALLERAINAKTNS